MLKKVIPLLSPSEQLFSNSHYFEGLKKPQYVESDEFLMLLTIFNIPHLSKFLLHILSVLEPVNGEVLIYGSALTNLLDSKTSALPPNDIDILVLCNQKKLSLNHFGCVYEYLDGLSYRTFSNYPFETINVNATPTVDINFFQKDKSQYNFKEVGRVFSKNQAIYLFKKNGKLIIQFKRVFNHSIDADILNPYSRNLNTVKIRLNQQLDSLSTLFDIHDFLTNNISYYYEQCQLEIERMKFKGNIIACYEFISRYSDIHSFSHENINFDFETFKINFYTFKSKLPVTTYSYSDLDVLLLLLDSYLFKLPHLIQLIESPSLNGSDLGSNDMSTIHSSEDSQSSTSQNDALSVVSLSLIEAKGYGSDENELNSSGLTSKESVEYISHSSISKASSGEVSETNIIPPSAVFLSKSSHDLMTVRSIVVKKDHDELTSKPTPSTVSKNECKVSKNKEALLDQKTKKSKPKKSKKKKYYFGTP